MAADYIDINRRAYDTLAEEYDQRAVLKSEFEERVDVLCGATLRHIAATLTCPHVLEIGPGSGEALAYFESAGCRTFAIDLSPQIAIVSKRRSPCTPILIGNVLNCEFVEGSFNIIYAGAVIHLFPLEDARKLLLSCLRWLAPGGIFFVNTTLHSSSEEGYSEKSDYGAPVIRFRRRWTQSEFVANIQSAGFQIVETLYTDEQDRGKQWIGHVCQKPAP